MLYEIAHFIRRKLPWMWNLIDKLNSFLFSIRCDKKLRLVSVNTKYEGYFLLPIGEVSTEQIVDFFARQPEEAYTFFKPHRFDYSSIQKLQNNKSFLAYLLIDKKTSNVAGYFFIRAFFWGKGYKGIMVDINCRGKGLSTMMNKILNEIGFGIGIRLFETVSKDNIASYKSVINTGPFKVIKEMDGKVLLIETYKDRTN